MAHTDEPEESDTESRRITKTSRFDADSWKQLEKLAGLRRMKATELLRDVVDALVDERMVMLERLEPEAREEIREFAKENRVDFAGAVFLMIVDSLNRRRGPRKAT